jgi:hypothetical protein
MHLFVLGYDAAILMEERGFTSLYCGLFCPSNNYVVILHLSYLATHISLAVQLN